jgi:adenine phosphoribosyltransferase
MRAGGECLPAPVCVLTRSRAQHATLAASLICLILGHQRADTLTEAATDLRALVREIPDFPTAGIGFKDITPLMADARALEQAVARLADYARPLHVDCVIAAEARGFLLGAALAVELGTGFALARKPGKLPYQTVSAEYLLEYGSGQLELHTDAVSRGKRVLVHDDLLATGGTAAALCELVEALGGEVAGCGFLIELAFLDGRERLAGRDVHALLTYES